LDHLADVPAFQPAILLKKKKEPPSSAPTPPAPKLLTPAALKAAVSEASGNKLQQAPGGLRQRQKNTASDAVSALYLAGAGTGRGNKSASLDRQDRQVSW
jgi:hypothetical protein